MKINSRSRGALKTLILLGISALLIGFSLINPIQGINSIYFPFINRLDPVENRLVLTEILFNPIGSEPGNEWIEIFNRSKVGIDLHGYKIGDSETRNDLEGMYEFPEGSHISPGKPMVIANQSVLFFVQFGFYPDFELLETDPEVPNLTKYRDWTGGAINLRNSGDEVLILNQKDELVDAASWGDSSFAFEPPLPKTEDGMSLERIPANVDSNNPSDWSILTEPGPGKVNLDIPTTTPGTGTATAPNCDYLPVLITEVFYDPEISAEPDGEWAEIYNFGDEQANLDCLMVGDEEITGGSEGMMTFPKGFVIPPRQVIVIANQADIFLTIHGFFPDFEIRETISAIPNLVDNPQWASGTISLSNNGDEFILNDIYGNQLDEVSWQDSDYAFHPPVPGVKPGHSISRQPAEIDSDSADDWVDLSEPQPGIVILTPPTQPPAPDTETPSPKPPSPTSTITPTPTSTDIPPPIIEIVINEILADPDSDIGDANNDGDVDYSDDEFIEIINNSSLAMDISSWSIGDVLELRHTFPAGTVIDPGCGLILFGGGSPIGNFGNFSVQTASSGNLGLNDNMEIIYIYDSQLEIITSLAYGEEGGDNQSITRDPDIAGTVPLRKHSLATGSNGEIYSPGTMINGSNFSGCTD
jgi:hypothetical protein